MAFWNRKKKEDEGEFITIKVRKRDLLPPYYVSLYETLYGLKYDAEEFLRDACEFGIARYTRQEKEDLRFNLQVEDDIAEYGEQMHDGCGRPLKKLLQMQKDGLRQKMKESASQGKTLREIAKELNVSHSTVHNYLRGDDPVAPPQGEMTEDKMEKTLNDGALSMVKPRKKCRTRLYKKLQEGEARVYINGTDRRFAVPAELSRRLIREGWLYYCFIFNMKEKRAFLALSKIESSVSRPVLIDQSGNRVRFGLLSTEIARIQTCLGLQFRNREGNYVHTAPPKVDDNGLLRIYLQK